MISKNRNSLMKKKKTARKIMQNTNFFQMCQQRVTLNCHIYFLQCQHILKNLGSRTKTQDLAWDLSHMFIHLKWYRFDLIMPYLQLHGHCSFSWKWTYILIHIFNKSFFLFYKIYSINLLSFCQALIVQHKNRTILAWLRNFS